MISAVAQQELLWLLKSAKPARVRTMREFAEQEVIIPDGPYAGRRFRCDRQPYTGLWLEAVDSGNWCRHVATGPTQSGKTLACFLIPLLYHLFEIGETVICGLPDMDMGGDKWREDILPVIEASRYKHLMPASGGGSRGGRVEAIQFRNGATLKFMSGGGGDKSRAGFTSRVVVVTETDGMDQPGASSREADKVTQLEARTRAYGSRKRIYLECTVSTQQGRTWQEYQRGTASTILLRCPHCRGRVSPEREHLTGWQEADSAVTAQRQALFQCPRCGAGWSESDRRSAHAGAELLHAGQEVDEQGVIQGTPRATETLGFRWSAVHNLFLTSGEIAADEWRASRNPDEENAEREMRQFVWCLPVLPSRWEETALQSEQIMQRLSVWPQGVIPAGSQDLTAGLDLGKYLCHWVLVAWQEEAVGQIVDYGRIEVPSVDLGVEQGLLVALREFRDQVLAGWPMGQDEREPGRVGKPERPQQVWVDSGYMTQVVYSFCLESGAPFLPVVGRGAAQQRLPSKYHPPGANASKVLKKGEGYHLARLAGSRVVLAEVDADHWKTWLQQRLTTPLGKPGALALFQAPPQEHLSLAKHLTSERKTEEFLVGKGVVTRWERVRKQNHWLDALNYACAAGHYAGVRLLPPEPEPVRISLSEIQRQQRNSPQVDQARWGDMMRRHHG